MRLMMEGKSLVFGVERMGGGGGVGVEPVRVRGG